MVINPETSAPAPATINAANSSISGFEPETHRLPLPNLLLTLNMILNDGEIDSFIDNQITLADRGIPPAGADPVPGGGMPVRHANRRADTTLAVQLQTRHRVLLRRFQLPLRTVAGGEPARPPRASDLAVGKWVLERRSVRQQPDR